jgi:hypothetical protein
MSIGTYFSHSYRVQDQALNKAFWSHFKSDFSFFVDPPSDVTIHTHLEAMMRRCSAFVAVFNLREDVPGLRCSPFMLYEYGLAVQARRPKLLLIHKDITSKTFGELDDNETFSFDPNDPDARLDELRKKIDRLKEVARAYPNTLYRQRGEIGVVVPGANSACAYATKEVLARIAEVADLYGFNISPLPVPHQHNAHLAVKLDQYEAIILDVRGTDLPDWVFPYAHGRLVPTIKLARLRPREVLGNFVMPPIVEGLRMDSAEPGVESVLYWRDADDLILQLDRAFARLDERQTEFKKDDEALFYFESIGRRPAHIFISNAGNENCLAGQLSKALRLRNIKQFHYKDPDYKDPDALQTNSDWPIKIRSEAKTCDVFVAIIGKGYEKRPWCREELRVARARDSQIVMLPYEVDGTDLSFLKEHDLQNRQVTSLPADQNAALSRILYDIQQALTDGGRGHNAAVRRTTMLGGSREAIVDTIRHLSGSSWPKLLARLSDDGIAVSLARKDKGPLRSRAVAEKLFEDAVRADTDPGNQSTLAMLVQALAKLAPASHRKLIKHVEQGIAKRGAT